MLTVSVVGADAPLTVTGSVMACVNRASTLTGPSTSTVDGSAVTVPTTNPSAGSPSTVGTIGTTLLPEGSNVIDTVDGFTCTTSTPNGVRTSGPLRWNNRRPDLADPPIPQQVDRAQALELARRDPLTGLYNRRGFLEQALPVYSTAMRRRRPLSVVMLDIDRFKLINDLHGHDAGDRTLVIAADMLRNACRLGDVVARWGGEEFVMLLPETQGDQAHKLAERLRESFARTKVALENGAEASFTASFGVAVRGESMDFEALLRESDAALYAAKHAGRDRVVSATDRRLSGQGAG